VILCRAPRRTAGRRLAVDRDGFRHPSDLADAEWAIVDPIIPR